MFRLRHNYLSILVLLSVFILSACSQPQEFFDPKVFSQSTTFTPLAELQTINDSDLTTSAISEMKLEEANQFLSSVMVTRSGKVSEHKLTEVDLAAWDNALSIINGFSPEYADSEFELDAGSEDLTTQSVIGRDTRRRIRTTTSYPYRAVGKIDIGCTGTLVGPRHVLTAGHCVYDIDNDLWYRSLDFSPGQNGSSRPYGKYSWEVAIAASGWVNSHSANHDYAMIILGTNIGNTVGWLSYGWRNPLPKYTVNIAGYPGDKPYGTMWATYCKIAVIRTDRFYYPCDTYGGMSGSGVYAYFSSTGSRIIYGIHAYGTGGSYPSSRYNSATRITQTKFNAINSWISAHP